MGLGSERGRLYSVLFLQSALQGLNCCAGVSASIGRGHAQHLPMLWFRTDEAPGFPYGDKVVFLANDWHAGLVPTYIAGKYRQHGVYKVRCSAMAANIQEPHAEGPEGGGCILTVYTPEDS